MDKIGSSFQHYRKGEAEETMGIGGTEEMNGYFL
jgi:hypothetical protein